MPDSLDDAQEVIMPRTQMLQNHRRWFPLYHFFAMPVLVAYALYAIWKAVTEPGWLTWGAALYAVAAACGLLAARVMALRVQDRVIRLEETIRLQRVLGGDAAVALAGLRPRHLIALRFASDDELPGLVRRTLAGELTDQKSIKREVVNWRPDWLRA
ncbi:MAG: DUF6526 family protein [Gemmatimonadota bacterium]